MALALHDTLRRAQRPFEPAEPGRVRMYVCGPTVQSEPHVGHGRLAVVMDTLRRHLAWSGYDVRTVVNITDVDDKIILRAAREDLPSAVVAERNAFAWNDAMDAVRVLRPSIQPRATGHIGEIQALIATLVEQDKAYERDGSVLFRVRAFEGYGKLSNRRVDDMRAGDADDTADGGGAGGKDDPLDFALWKAAKPGEPAWPSPWGPGRPGWHIECSAMASTHLGGDIDIHGGGFDLVFPHHENEIAQYEAAHGETYVRNWVHTGMLRLGEEKMSKSLGNIVGLEEAAEQWGGGVLRLWYLSAHHRSPITYEDDHLEDATRAWERLVTFLRLADLTGREGGTDERPEATKPFVDAFTQAMDDDLNAPRAVAALHDLVTAGNDALKRADRGDDAAAADAAALAATLTELADDVLGLGLGSVVATSRARGEQLAELVEALLEQRVDARQDKDWARADAIRDQLTRAGIVVEDRAQGSRWYVQPTPA